MEHSASLDMTTPGTTKSASTTPFYMFLSVDTDGVGTLVPFTQHVVRLAFTVMTPQFKLVTMDHFFVFQGHNTACQLYSVEQLATGVPVTEACQRLFQHASQVLHENGVIVVHNKQFIVSALQSMGCSFTTLQHLYKAMYCTMEAAAVLGPKLKYPNLLEMCTFLLPILSLTASQLQQAPDKVVLLAQCYKRGKEIMLFI